MFLPLGSFGARKLTSKWAQNQNNLTLATLWEAFWAPLDGLWSSLERQVTLEAELWVHTKFPSQNKQISASIRQKMKRWTSKLERLHHFFEKA